MHALRWVALAALAAAAALGAGAALWLLRRLALWMESRDWIYYRRKPPGTMAGMAMQELHALIQPSARHLQQAAQADRLGEEDEDAAGEGVR